MRVSEAQLLLNWTSAWVTELLRCGPQIPRCRAAGPGPTAAAQADRDRHGASGSRDYHDWTVSGTWIMTQIVTRQTVRRHSDCESLSGRSDRDSESERVRRPGTINLGPAVTFSDICNSILCYTGDYIFKYLHFTSILLYIFFIFSSIVKHITQCRS